MRLNGVIIYSPQELDAIQKAIQFVDQKFNESLSAEDLSDQFGIPIKKLQRGFSRQQAIRSMIIYCK